MFSPTWWAALGKRARLRLLEKGNKEQLVWLHHEAEAYLDAYIAAAGIRGGESPLFQSLDKAHKLTGEAISRRDMLRVVKTRCIAAGLSEAFCNHTFRGTGMTVLLSNGGSLEAARDMANHADPRTTKLYDRRKDLAKLSEIERRLEEAGRQLPRQPICKLLARRLKGLLIHLHDGRSVYVLLPKINQSLFLVGNGVSRLPEMTRYHFLVKRKLRPVLCGHENAAPHGGHSRAQ
jgi:hypothetical protein